MSKKGIGLAALAIASLYLRKKNIERKRKAPITKKKSKSTPVERRRTPVQIITEDRDIIEDETVYLVGNGKKYHLERDCRGIRKNSTVKKINLKEAIEKGYTLCGWETSERGE